ncbi:hypothetical protein EMCRGX_G025693 [Ephydatia muelleri]
MQGSNYVCPSCFHLLRLRCYAPLGVPTPQLLALSSSSVNCPVVHNLQPSTQCSFVEAACTTAGCQTGGVANVTNWIGHSPVNTYNPSGILLYQINSVMTDFLGVKLHGGLPWLIFDVGSGQAVVGSNSTRTFNDAPDGFDAVSVQNVGSTYIIVSWDLPTDSNGILINFSLYCNGALAGVLPLTVISYNTTGLLPFTLYMYITLSVGQVLQSRPQELHSSWNVVLGIISAAASLPSHVHHEEDSPPGGPHDPELDTDDIVISIFINKIINPDKSFGSSDPICILLLQLSSLLVEHTAPNIHDFNKNCYLCWSWGLTDATKPTRAVQDSVADTYVHEDWTTYPMEELTATPPYPS